MRKKGIYVLYKGEDQISKEDTVENLAKEFKVRKETLYFYMKPAYHKRCKKNYRVLVRVE